MQNRIRRVQMFPSRLDPAESELWVTVFPEQLTSTTQIRGRLMGPRCAYASTVEIAYPWREWSRQYEKDGEPSVCLRIIIPEASFWDPESPFLYEGRLELWQGGECCDQVEISAGLRTVNLGPQGIRWNGRLLKLRGAIVGQLQKDDARRLRETGCNALLAAPTSAAVDLWSAADRFGFLMLGRITNKSDLSQASVLAKHPSSLGFLLDCRLLEDPLLQIGVGALLQADVEGQLLGVELTSAPEQPLPMAVSFVACEMTAKPALAVLNVATIVMGERWPSKEESARAATVLGWIDPTL